MVNPNEVRIIPWQEEWGREFHLEKQAIIGACMAEDHTVEVLHVGSTSVKGMVSKPIIDILVCPDHIVPLEAVVADLERIEYRNLGECGRPGRFFLIDPEEKYHIHLCYKENQVAQDMLLFQKLERENEVVFQSYLKLKTMLGSEFCDDRFMYRTLKGYYVDGVLAAARTAMP